MDWKDFITRTALKSGRYDDPGEFGPPSTKQELETIWKYSGGRIPSDLLELLSQANGVGAAGGGRFIFNIADILKNNEQCRTEETYREHCEPFDDILFFADPAWTGDYFGYDFAKPDVPIIRWMAIGDDRDWKARDLQDFIEGWYADRISA